MNTKNTPHGTRATVRVRSERERPMAVLCLLSESLSEALCVVEVELGSRVQQWRVGVGVKRVLELWTYCYRVLAITCVQSCWCLVMLTPQQKPSVRVAKWRVIRTQRILYGVYEALDHTACCLVCRHGYSAIQHSVVCAHNTVRQLEQHVSLRQRTRSQVT